jgi:hypothetical protein
MAPTRRPRARHRSAIGRHRRRFPSGLLFLDAWQVRRTERNLARDVKGNVRMSDQVKTRLVLLILVSLFLIAASPSVRKIPLRSQR